MLMFIVLMTCVFAGWMGGCELSVSAQFRPWSSSIDQWRFARREYPGGSPKLVASRHKLKKRFLDFLSRALAEFWL